MADLSPPVVAAGDHRRAPVACTVLNGGLAECWNACCTAVRDRRRSARRRSRAVEEAVRGSGGRVSVGSCA